MEFIAFLLLVGLYIIDCTLEGVREQNKETNRLLRKIAGEEEAAPTENTSQPTENNQ